MGYKRKQNGMQTFTHHLGDVELVCHIEYEPPCRGSRECGVQMEPDEPESCALCAALVGEIDVISMLSDEQIAEIEEAFLIQNDGE